MLKWRPLRLRGRIGLIVMLHLLMMVAVIVAFGRRGDAPVYRLPDPAQVALIATAFERTPRASHEDMARAFSGTTLRVRLIGALPTEIAGAATPATMALYREALAGRPFRIAAYGNSRPASFDGAIPLSIDAIRVFVALPDGRALAIEQMVLTPAARIFGNFMLFLLAVVIVDIIVILWLASQTTRPVERLARAVHDDRLETLPPNGPREIIELADTVRQLRRHLRELLHERTRMLAAIAHDYRTYLTRLELRSEFIDDPEQRALAEQDIGEMRDLLSDTLTFARESITDDMDHAICDIRKAIVAIAAERRDNGEDISVEAIDGPLFVHASRLSFQRMLVNLLDNAIRHGGGHALIRVRGHDDVVQVCIEDDGPGVPENSIDRMMEPFERLEPSRARATGGVGLGLSIVQALARRYRGDLRIENRDEGGFRAILILRIAGNSRPHP